MQSNGDRRKEYAALEKEHVAVEKEIQKHPHQRREDREGVRRRQEGDPEAPDPKVALKVLVAGPLPTRQKDLERQAGEHRRDHGPIAARQGQGIEALMHSCQDAAFKRNLSL